MEGRLSAVCALILVLGVIGAQATSLIGDKPGVCPPPDYFNNPEFCARTRFRECFIDSQCKKNDKCCNNGCARVCTPVRRVKPGICPRFPSIIGGICEVRGLPVCDDDYDCPGTEKCCWDQCGTTRLCANSLVKPGHCPPFPFDEASPCPRHRTCSHDFQCFNNWKCCRNQCGKGCSPPLDNWIG